MAVGSYRLVVVDLVSGAVTSTAVSGGPEQRGPAQLGPPVFVKAYGEDQLAWRSDSRHILLRNQVLDLNGRVVAVHRSDAPGADTF